METIVLSERGVLVSSERYVAAGETIPLGSISSFRAITERPNWWSWGKWPSVIGLAVSSAYCSVMGWTVFSYLAAFAVRPAAPSKPRHWILVTSRGRELPGLCDDDPAFILRVNDALTKATGRRTTGRSELGTA